MKIPCCIFLWLCCMACTHQSTRRENKEITNDTVKRKDTYFALGSSSDSVVRDGEQIRYHKNGVMEMQGLMKDGKRDGLWKSWYENGLPWSETTFKNGIKEGKTTTWYDNGNKRYEGFFKNDKESGRWVFWNEDGTLSDTKNYDLKLN